MNNDNMGKLIACLTERNEEERFDITRFLHACGTPSCIIGWAYTLQTGFDKVYVPEEEMLKATAEYLNIDYDQAVEIATGWENVVDYDAEDDDDMYVWANDPIPFEIVLAYLNALKEDQYLSWQEFYDVYVS